MEVNHTSMYYYATGGVLTVNGLTDMGRWTLEVDSGAEKEAKPTNEERSSFSN